MRKILLTSFFFLLFFSGYLFFDFSKNVKVLSDFFLKKRIEQIEIFNLNSLSSEYLLDSIEVKKGDSFWNYSFLKLQKNLKNIKEIDEFNFNLKSDGTLKIYVKEKLPFMIWQNSGKIHYIDENGNILKLNITPLPDLIILHGSNANKKIKHLSEVLLKHPSIKSRILKIFLLDHKKWKLFLKDNSCLKLPEEKINQAIEVFKKIKDKKKFKDYKEFDMQINGRVYLNKKQCLI